MHFDQSIPNDNVAVFLSTNLQYSLSKSDLTTRLLHKTTHQHVLPSLLFPIADITYFDTLYYRLSEIINNSSLKKQKSR